MITLKIFKNYKQASKYLAKFIIENIKYNNNSSIGLASGSTFTCLYKYLSLDHINNQTDWSNIKTFNLDEYIITDIRQHRVSCLSFMKYNLFDNININIKNVHFPPNVIETKELKKYDRLLKKSTFLFQILGLGENGHIGYNEPHCDFSLKTHVNKLSKETINYKKKAFKYSHLFPKLASTVGISTILKMKFLILVAFGSVKAKALEQLITTKQITNQWPLTSLRKHKELIIVTDKSLMKCIKTNKLLHDIQIEEF